MYYFIVGNGETAISQHSQGTSNPASRSEAEKKGLDCASQTDPVVVLSNQTLSAMKRKIALLESSLEMAIKTKTDTRRFSETLDRLEVSGKERHKETTQNIAYIVGLVKPKTAVGKRPFQSGSSSHMQALNAESPSSTSSSDSSQKAKGQSIVEGDSILVGGWPNIKVPVTTYVQMVIRARKHNGEADRFLAIELLKNPNVFNPLDLSQANATGCTRVNNKKAAYPKLDRERLTALCRQIRLEFPDSLISCGGGSCPIMQAINNFCRKRKLQEEKRLRADESN